MKDRFNDRENIFKSLRAIAEKKSRKIERPQFDY